MMSTSFSLLNISCSCIECTSFLHPYPKEAPSCSPLPGIFSNLALSAPSPPPHTPRLASRLTTLSTHLRPTPRTLAPSPNFLLTRQQPPLQLRTNTPTPPPSKILSHLPPSPHTQLPNSRLKRATHLSRCLLFGLSSPINEAKTPLSAKTPGLALCTSTACFAKVVPGFGNGASVCKMCEQELRGAVSGLLDGGESHPGATSAGSNSSRVSIPSTPSSFEEQEASDTEAERYTEEEEESKTEKEARLFAIPGTPLGHQQLLAKSLCTAPRSARRTPDQRSARVSLPLFALPNVALDTEAYEEVTPVTRYTMNFPILPERSSGFNKDNTVIAQPAIISTLAAKAEMTKVTQTWSGVIQKRNN